MITTAISLLLQLQPGLRPSLTHKTLQLRPTYILYDTITTVLHWLLVDYFLGCWIDSLEHVVVKTINELPIDEELVRHGNVHSIHMHFDLSETNVEMTHQHTADRQGHTNIP